MRLGCLAILGSVWPWNLLAGFCFWLAHGFYLEKPMFGNVEIVAIGIRSTDLGIGPSIGTRFRQFVVVDLFHLLHNSLTAFSLVFVQHLHLKNIHIKGREFPSILRANGQMLYLRHTNLLLCYLINPLFLADASCQVTRRFKVPGSTSRTLNVEP